MADETVASKIREPVQEKPKTEAQPAALEAEAYFDPLHPDAMASIYAAVSAAATAAGASPVDSGDIQASSWTVPSLPNGDRANGSAKRSRRSGLRAAAAVGPFEEGNALEVQQPANDAADDTSFTQDASETASSRRGSRRRRARSEGK